MAIPILKVAATVIFILSLAILPSKSAETEDLLNGSKSSGNINNIEGKRKMVVGSRPPECANKCLSCRPCMATLVVTTQRNKLFRTSAFHGDDDSYYLLSWKCKCGNKFFQP